MGVQSGHTIGTDADDEADCLPNPGSGTPDNRRRAHRENASALKMGLDYIL